MFHPVSGSFTLLRPYFHAIEKNALGPSFIPELFCMSASCINILHIEDDPNDALLFRHACSTAGVGFELRAVCDGDEAIAYLRGAEQFADRKQHPVPHIILLDLKMPRLSGFEVLSWLRSENAFRKIPVIILTSSNHESDIKRAYDLGANSYVVKPVGFDALVEVARKINGYWVKFNHPAATTSQ